MGKRIVLTSALVGAIVCALAAPAAAHVTVDPPSAPQGLDREAVVPRAERGADREGHRGADRVPDAAGDTDPDGVASSRSRAGT